VNGSRKHYSLKRATTITTIKSFIVQASGDLDKVTLSEIIVRQTIQIRKKSSPETCPEFAD
jgi:hypothetical protein